MTSCQACGAHMVVLPSWSGNKRLSWERCHECGRRELAVDESVTPMGCLEYAEYDFAKLRERARGGKNRE